jgi:hypothetical protein
MCLHDIERCDTEIWVTQTLLPAVLRSPDDHGLAEMICIIFSELWKRVG